MRWNQKAAIPVRIEIASMRRHRQKRPRLTWLHAGIPGDWKWPLVSLLVVAGSAAATLALLIGLFRLLS